MEEVSTVENPPAAVDAREAGLIRDVQKGDRESFYGLVQPYERKLYAAAFSILRNEQDAEDAVQEAMLKALKNLGQFRFEAKFSTWLIQITINEARMRRRKQNARVMEPIGETANDEGTYTPRDFADWREIPSESLERKEVRELLLEALASLGEKYREIFILRDVNHLSIEEVSKTLGISHASVKTRLLRARLMLRDLLAPKMSAGWFKSGLFSSAPLQKGTKPW